MLFKGTKTQSANQIAQSIQDVGGYINAYTSFDRTVFWIDVPKDGVGTALKVLSDAMMNSTLPPAEYQKEQEVIRREFAMTKVKTFTVGLPVTDLNSAIKWYR